MEGKTEAFIGWLKGLPHGAEVKWHSLNVFAAEQWASYCVDIGVEAFESGGTATNCGITFVRPHHPYVGQPGHFVLKRDMDVHAVYDSADRFQSFTIEIAVPRGAALTDEQEARMVAAAAATPTCVRGVGSAWSVNALSAGLHIWCIAHTGRKLNWVWDEAWRPPPAIQAILDSTAQTTQPTYQVGPGLRVTDQVFDTLLALPGTFSPGPVSRRRQRLMTTAKEARRDNPFAM